MAQANSIERQLPLTQRKWNARSIRPFYSPGLFALAQVADAIEQHRQDDGAADEGALPEGVDAEQAEAVADDLDQRRANQGAEPAGLDDAGDAGRQGRDDVDRHLDRADRHAGQGRRMLVAADGIDMAAE